LLQASLTALAVLGAVAVFNAYRLDGQVEGQGLPLPLLVWGVVVVVLGFLARHMRLGRYVYAIALAHRHRGRRHRRREPGRWE
jgi:D-xylose transport system permease protein